MGLFDLPAPFLGAVDQVFGLVLPAGLRLVLWGVLAGWLTMLAYRKLSNQERISALKAEQKIQQKVLAGFDGEFGELMPLIRNTLGLGFRQLGLSIGPAALATIPVLFLLAWVAGQFGYQLPPSGQAVRITITPPKASIEWQPEYAARQTEDGWELAWPADDNSVVMEIADRRLLAFPLPEPVPVIHKKQWWNGLFANPLGYVPFDLPVDKVEIGLAQQQFLPFGPGWVRGWMFSFFFSFLLSTLGFKFALRID